MREFEDEIIFPREIKIDENANLPELVSILPVRNTVLFPFSMLPLTVGRGSSIQLIEDLKPSHQF